MKRRIPHWNQSPAMIWMPEMSSKVAPRLYCCPVGCHNCTASASRIILLFWIAVATEKLGINYLVNNLATNKRASSKGPKLLEVLLWEYSCPSSDKDYYDGSWTMSQMSSFKLTYKVIEQSTQKESLFM